jgi:hypothetical protein
MNRHSMRCCSSVNPHHMLGLLDIIQVAFGVLFYSIKTQLGSVEKDRAAQAASTGRIMARH